MSLLMIARTNRLKALADVEAREQNLFAGCARRPEAPAAFRTQRAA